MSNLMSEESLNSYPILRSDESSVSKHLLIIYPLVPRLLFKELLILDHLVFETPLMATDSIQDLLLHGIPFLFLFIFT